MQNEGPFAQSPVAQAFRPAHSSFFILHFAFFISLLRAVRSAHGASILALTVTPRLTVALVVAAATTLTLSAQSAAPIADPAFHFIASSGCGHVFLYAWDTSRSEVLTAFIDKKKLALGPGTHVIDIAAARDGVAVGIDVYSSPNTAWVDVHGNPAPRLPYCNDLGPFARPATTWRAVAGTATLTIGKPGEVPPGSQPFMYKATLRVEGLIIVGPDGRKLSAPAPVVLSGTVGWVAG